MVRGMALTPNFCRAMFFVALTWIAFFAWHRDELDTLTLVGVIGMFAWFAGVFAAGWSRGDISVPRADYRRHQPQVEPRSATDLPATDLPVQRAEEQQLLPRY